MVNLLGTVILLRSFPDDSGLVDVDRGHRALRVPFVQRFTARDDLFGPDLQAPQCPLLRTKKQGT